MTILFAASELEAFQVSSVTDITGVTTGDTFDSLTGRAGMRIQQNAVAAVDFAAQAEGWLHFRAYDEDTSQAGSATFTFRLVDSGSGEVGVFQLTNDFTDYEVDILNTSPTGWTIPSSSIFGQLKFHVTTKTEANTRWENSGILADDSSYTVDFHWVISDTVGVMDMYINGVLVTHFSGDTLRLTQTTVDRLELSNGNSSTNGVIFSEVIVADEDTRGMRVVTLTPDGNGASTAWTGDVTDIDETALNDVDLITTNTTAQEELFTSGNLVNDHYDVLAFVVGFRGQDDVTDVQQVAAMLRTNSLNFNGATQPMPAAFAGHYEVWNLNPDSAAAWTPAQIDAIEYGVEAIT